MNKIILLVLVFFLLEACNDIKEEKLLASHKLKNGGGIGIYYVGVGATANENIQVRRGGKNSPIWFTEKYDTLLSSKLINDSSLELILAAKGIYDKPLKADTLLVDIK